ncbi:1,4-dihydroxy-2-naphthoate octaprenyltransferase [Croceivirga lutea]|uniref:1,4-dihydroxy-2-naphthoate octaprenyltransferase n=1 Tax=Croceivirga lutea TaxID=1775167 RepID=UPI00163ACD90|nr:1,4-dihydroxy-2-naphthoate octaprenyltransferase [Croceivirga lutea]
MSKFKVWLNAARLRTLPLSLAGIIMGTAIANYKGFSNTFVFGLALLTTVLFQITSNFANDYGDGTKGTDSTDRVGPNRALQSGLLSQKELKKGIILFSILSLLASILLLIVAFGKAYTLYFIFFLILAVLAVIAAIKYTMGDTPYGYKGLGDVFVFIFFGLVAVLGTEFLYTKTFDVISILPAIVIGLLSVAVLNLNNLRDHVSDFNHGKITLVVKMGFQKGKVYHFLIVGLAIVLLLWYSFLLKQPITNLFFLLSLLPLIFNLIKVQRTKEPKNLDSELKKVALSTFLLAVTFYIAINYFF